MVRRDIPSPSALLGQSVLNDLALLPEAIEGRFRQILLHPFVQLLKRPSDLLDRGSGFASRLMSSLRASLFTRINSSSLQLYGLCIASLRVRNDKDHDSVMTEGGVDNQLPGI